MAAVQLLNFADRFGTTHPAAYAKIMKYEALLPALALQKCTIFIWKDEAAFLADQDYLFSEERQLAFNPNTPGAETAAYAQLADSGGIYEGSTVV